MCGKHRGEGECARNWSPLHEKYDAEHGFPLESDPLISALTSMGFNVVLAERGIERLPDLPCVIVQRDDCRYVSETNFFGHYAIEMITPLIREKDDWVNRVDHPETLWQRLNECLHKILPTGSKIVFGDRGRGPSRLFMPNPAIPVRLDSFYVMTYPMDIHP